MGEILALGCALIWACSIIVFKFNLNHVEPRLLNLMKNTVGFFCLIPTVYYYENAWIIETDWPTLFLLWFSGFIGIGIADGLVFVALQKVGASRLAIIECLYSPSVIFFSWLLRGQALTWNDFLGTCCVISAVFIVTMPKKFSQPITYSIPQSDYLYGIFAGCLSMILMGGGIVIVKPIFDQLPLFWIIEMRLFAGVIGSIFSFYFVANKKTHLQNIFIYKNKLPILIASCFTSAYISMILWVSSFKFLEPAKAAILTQTSTIFTVILAIIFLKEHLTWRKIIATSLAVVGVIIVVNGS